MDFLADQPIALLFAVIGVGTAIGNVRVRGFGLGPAAVLFVGIAVAAADDRLVLDETFLMLGLVLFTYTVGLATGPAFAAGLRGRGLRSVAVVLAAVLVAGLVAASAVALLDEPRTEVAGLFAGAVTNTPALGAVVDTAGPDAGAQAAVLYTLAYPGGVLCSLVAAHLVLRRARRHGSPAAEPIVSWTIEVTSPAEIDPRLLDGPIVLSRHARGAEVRVAPARVVCQPGDLITAVGPEAALRRLAEAVGVRAGTDLTADRGTLDFRRITVSAPAVVGRSLGELDLGGRFGATATRLRRGDLDLVATDDLVLEPGDRVRIVAPVARLSELARLFGDSEHQLSDLDFVPLALGFVAGVGLGTVTFPGGLHLGAAGGTLMAGLVLGAVGRVRSVHFSLPHQASLGLRQLGIVVFLAAVGTRSGSAFADAAFSWTGLRAAGIGAAASAAAMATVMWTGRRWARLDDVSLAGAIAGAQTQPAVLAFAESATGHDQRVAVGYTALFPAAMVLKIVAAQVLAHT